MIRDDAYPTCRFYVQIDDTFQAMFTEVSGLQVEVAVEPIEEGGLNEFGLSCTDFEADRL